MIFNPGDKNADLDQHMYQHKSVITEVTKRCELIGLFQQMLKVSIINGKV